MPPARNAIVTNRRRFVAQLRLRGMSQDEIVQALAQQGVTNPETRTAWSKGTVNADCRALDAEWQLEAAQATGTLKASMLARLREVARAAWGKNDLRAVLAAYKQEAELLGLDAPVRFDLAARIRVWAEREGLDDAERAELHRDVEAHLAVMRALPPP
jgi:hypothetical protein